MKLNISLSMHHKKDKDVLDILNEQENVSGYVRSAIRFYSANNNGVANYNDLKTMMETLLVKMENMTHNKITYIQEETPHGNISPLITNPKVSGVGKIGNKINTLTKQTENASVEDNNEKLTDIGNAIDGLGNV